jgi:L-ascorbate metabolism protein UlaG (beta-lactamase superfamily)
LAHRYQNADPSHRPHGPAAIIRWGITDRLTGRRKRSPIGPPAPHVQPDLELIGTNPGPPFLTWIGHASFLGSLAGCRFLIDPVFSGHAGWFYRRYSPPALQLAELPELTAVMVTHNHYDHLDEAVFRALPPEVTIVVPLGMGRWMSRRGRRRVIELEWWQSAEVDGLHVTLVPACHWSRRGVFDTNRALWGGFVIEGGRHCIYHSGDTAWFDGFAEIGRRFPSIDVVMLPIGGYEPAWFMEHYHLNPEQAGRAFTETGASRLLPMHWGTFQLTDEPLCEPVGRMHDWWRREGPEDSPSLDLLAVGESLLLDDGRGLYSRMKNFQPPPSMATGFCGWPPSSRFLAIRAPRAIAGRSPCSRNVSRISV